MARRAPNNPRYQKYTGPEGKTRKSAAAAKPKKASSSSSKPNGGKSKSGAKSKTSAIAMRNPETPEFKAYRRQWWIALVVGLVLTAVSWGLQQYVRAPWARTAQTVTLALAYAAIIYAFYIDWTKMRPLRKKAYEDAKSGKAPKPAAEKPSKTDIKAAQSDADDTETGSDTE